MLSKRIILSAVLLCMLTAAMAGYHWWKGTDKMSALPPERELPAAAAELGKILQRYRLTADSAGDIEGTIRIYDRENKETLKETRSFRFQRCSPGYYTRLSSLQTFCDGKWLVQLDSVNRQIVVAKAPRETGGMNGFPGDMGPLETLLKDTTRFPFSGTVTADGKHRRLRLQNEGMPQLRSSTLVYDTLTYRLDEAEMEWWKPGAGIDSGNKIWLAKIDYQYRVASPMDMTARIRSIFTMEKGRVVLTPAYQGYMINTTNN